METIEMMTEMKAVPNLGCHGCAFYDRDYKGCLEVREEAVKQHLPDCEDSHGYIYIKGDSKDGIGSHRP